MDVGRIKFMLAEWGTLAALKKAIGPVAVNYDQCNPDLTAARRLNKDA